MLKVLEELSEYISRDIGLDKEYVYLTILTIFTILFFSPLSFFCILKLLLFLNELSDSLKILIIFLLLDLIVEKLL